jgi:hypothetical protein
MMEDHELREMEARCRGTWDYVENYFIENEKTKPQRLQAIVRVIRELRLQGYDQWFYISRLSNYAFMIWQSQSCINFYLMLNESEPYYTLRVIGHIANEKSYDLGQQSLPFSTEFKILLELLIVQPMD